MTSIRRNAHGPVCVNGKWLAQRPSGTQRYATEVVRRVASSPIAPSVRLILPSDAAEPPWADRCQVIRSRFRGTFFEQIALPWLSRGSHLYSLAGPAPVFKRNQTLVMHDAMPFRVAGTFSALFVVWYRMMYMVLARTARRVFTVSPFSREDLADALRVSPDRFGLASCGADHVPEESEDEGVETLPFAPDTFALIVGNLAPHKNVAPTAHRLAEAGVQVVVVGQEQRGVFRAAAVGGHRHIRLLGGVDDHRLHQLYSAAAVLVAPSTFEGFGLPLVEAGRRGCPAVFAGGSAMTEVAGDGGLVFDPTRPEDGVEQARRLIEDPAWRLELGDRARVNSRRFAWADTAAALFGEAGYSPAEPPSSDRPMRVLHITEAFSAGTGTAIVHYAFALRRQGVESHLLVQDRGSGMLGELDRTHPFASRQLVPGGITALWRAIGVAVRELRPDIVHLHSSVAGGVGRLRLGLQPGAPPIVYSPHCFAFERRDVSIFQRRLYRVVETFLARSTAGFVCVSPHEAALATALAPRMTVVNVANTFDITEWPPARRHGENIRLSAVGRVTAQKAPALMIEIVATLRRKGYRVEATWVGHGDPQSVAALVESGIGVTGWLPAAEVREHTARSSVFVHTAGWEAALPIAVLDAMALGVPVVVRRNAAYAGMVPDDWQFDDVESAVREIEALAVGRERDTRIRAQSARLDELRRRGPEVVLAEGYRGIVAARRRPRRRSGPVSPLLAARHVDTTTESAL